MTQGDNITTYSKVATAQVASSFFLISEFNFSDFGIYVSVTGAYTLNISVIGPYPGVSEQVGPGHFSAS